jgi:hypothetical protein
VQYVDNDTGIDSMTNLSHTVFSCVGIDEHLISIKVDNKSPVEDFSSMQLLPPTIIAKATTPIVYR